MKLYNRKQAAKYLGRSVVGIIQLEKNGHLEPTPTAAGQVRFTRRKLDNFKPPKMGRPSSAVRIEECIEKLAVYIGTLPPNTKLTTAGLTSITGAKQRTTLRALHRLANAGLVKHNGKRGASSWWKVL